jgi:hypothetical protein
MGDALLRKPISGFAGCCCAGAVTGHITAVPATNVMNSRRLMASPAEDQVEYVEIYTKSESGNLLVPGESQASVHVRFGSKADIRIVHHHVRFTPKADIAR